MICCFDTKRLLGFCGLGYDDRLFDQAIMKLFHALFVGGLLWADVTAYVPSKATKSKPAAAKLQSSIFGRILHLASSSFFALMVLVMNRGNAQNGKALI